jgi:hypothetical protein
MNNAAQYREYAEQCRKLAKSMKGEHRHTLLSIAEAWETCARELEEGQSRRSDMKTDGRDSDPELR